MVDWKVEVRSPELGGPSLRSFVGRDREIALIRDALAAEAWPSRVLLVHGPAGIGKTALLWRWRVECERAHVPTTYIDARLWVGLGPSVHEAAITALRRSARRRVLFVDGGDVIIDGALEPAHRLLACMPERCLVVLATRCETAGECITAGISNVHTSRLGPLAETDVERFLELRGVPADRRTELARRAHDHPLRLAELTTAPRTETEAEATAPDLLNDLLAEATSDDEREALEVAAIVRWTREDTLGELVGADRARELFDWLRRVSFVESGPHGLAPQRFARDAIARDLRWRNPKRWQDIRRRAAADALARFAERDATEEGRALSDYLFLAAAPEELAELAELWFRAPAQEEQAAVLELVRAHQDEESARAIESSLTCGPADFRTCRVGDRVLGAMRIRALDPARDRPISERGVAGILGRLRDGDELREGEHACLVQVWSTVDGPILSRCVLLETVRVALARQDLALVFLAFWGEPPDTMLRRLGAVRMPALDWNGGAHTCSVYRQDWRVHPPEEWLAGLASGDGAAPPEARYAALTRPEFDAAARQAVRGYADVEALRGNPLLGTRLVLYRTGGRDDVAARVGALRAVIGTAVEGLRATPRLQKLHRALWRTYVEPAPTQEAAADLLGLPLSTYRRHLKNAIDHVVERLWHLELAGTRRK